jgi:hypothetical protein
MNIKALRRPSHVGRATSQPTPTARTFAAAARAAGDHGTALARQPDPTRLAAALTLPGLAAAPRLAQCSWATNV